MTNKNVWNELASEYIHVDNVMDWRLGYSVVESILNTPQGNIKKKYILDYGCGPGKFSRKLADLGAIIHGVDTSENTIREAKRIGGDIKYTVLNHETSLLPDREQFDYAVINFVLCTIQEQSTIEYVVKNAYLSLKNNGLLVILDPHPDSLGRDFLSMKRKKPPLTYSGVPVEVTLEGMSHSFYDYWRSMEDYTTLLQKAGFSVEEIREPIITNSYEGFWRDERTFPPLLTISARKE